MVGGVWWPELRWLSHRMVWAIRGAIWLLVTSAALQVVSVVLEHRAIEPWRWVITVVAGSIAVASSALAWIYAGRTRVGTPETRSRSWTGEEHRAARRALLAGQALDDHQRLLVAVQVGQHDRTRGLMLLLIVSPSTQVTVAAAGSTSSSSSGLWLIVVGWLGCVLGAVLFVVEMSRGRRVRAAAQQVAAVPLFADRPVRRRRVLGPYLALAMSFVTFVLLGSQKLQVDAGLGRGTALVLAVLASLAAMSGLLVVVQLVLPARWIGRHTA